MAAIDTLPAEEIAELRQKHYNATVVAVRRQNEELIVLRVRPDLGVPTYKAGQYTVLGLGYWERRIEGAQPEALRPGQERKVAKRAYSICSPILDEQGELVDPAACDYLEFYIVLVKDAGQRAPVLTPRLFCLGEGDRLFVGPKVTGHYTLDAVQPGQDVFFMSTGTGEAPHNAMLVELLRAGHTGRIISACCVRRWRDLAYRETYDEIVRRYPNCSYHPLTTREPENLDETHPGYVGKRYIQDVIESGEIERWYGGPFDPAASHFFFCGNPKMIGIPEIDKEGTRVYPKPRGAIEVLEARGFRADETGRPGNIHFEKYW